MKLKELIDVIPEITSVRIQINNTLIDRCYLFTSEIEADLSDYDVTVVSVDYTRRFRLFIILEEPND